jgi:hypothetical protein
MGLLDVFFGNKISKSVDQKPRTGFSNQYGEELARYLTESDVQLLNNAVDSNGGITAEIAETLKCVKYYKKIFDFNATDTGRELWRAGLCAEDARRLAGVIMRWAMGIKR